MAKFDHEFNLNTCLPINVAEKYMNGPQLVGTWFSESICFKYLSSFSPQPIRSVRDQTFSTRELFIRPLHLILFQIFKFIKKDISNDLDYFQKHLSDPFGSICIFPNIFAGLFLKFLNVYENICMIISDAFEYSWKYLSDPF